MEDGNYYTGADSQQTNTAEWLQADLNNFGTLVVVRETHIQNILLSIYPPGLYFDDQFAFRPTSSTTAAIIAFFHIILTMRSTNPFVRVFALDFSKVFDTIWHASLMDKMAQLELSDQTFNWIKDFFDNRSHCTKYSGKISTCANIQASEIQGSGLGPATYLVTASGLRPVHGGNKVVKFSDNTCDRASREQRNLCHGTFTC